MTDGFTENIKKLLVLGPHPDDGEFSSGGTIAKMLEHGVEVHYAVFSMCEKSVPKGYEPDAIKNELIAAAKFMGIEQNLIMYNYEVRCFPEHRQSILEDLVALDRRLKPDLVLLPSSADVHQDHKTIHEEGVRAFKNTRILGYEMPWNNFTFHSNMYVALEERHIQKKIEWIDKYETQKFRYYSSDEFVNSLSKLRGIQIRKPYAEAFEMIRWIM
jgi:LmbE family N-acetylglucosaminyl deacetylase